MRKTTTTNVTKGGALLAAALLALAALLPARAGRADDTALFSAAVPPNVLLVIDNSGSMNMVVWHPNYDPTSDPSCNYWDDNGSYNVTTTNSDTFPSGATDTSFRAGTYSLPGTGTSAGCVTSNREIFVDPQVEAAGNSTRWDGHYLNWYFSAVSDAYTAEITTTNNGAYSACLGGGTFSLYRRARVSAAKNILKDVICQVNQQGKVRFGLAQFRTSTMASDNDGFGTDVNGGYALVPINDYYQADGVTPNTYTLNGVNQSHGDHLDDAIESLEGESWTPLAETLFQTYTYFMSRTVADIPFGKDGVTRFPLYTYRPRETGAGGDHTTLGVPTVPDSPVLYDCQKHFVVMITDGEPTRDDFDVTDVVNNTNGFAQFRNELIGDYNPDGEVEEPAPTAAICGTTANCEPAMYLDDIAKFMHEVDFMPNRDDAQTLDVYTVGFTTTPFANAILQKTADVGNGQFFFSNNAEELSDAIVSVITDIIEKSQSFTAATVPASRTVEGNQIYISYFIPADDTGFWEGHLKNYTFTADGEILAADGSCLTGSATDFPPCPEDGTLRTNAAGVWDAASAMPAAASRSLYYSKLPSTTSVLPPLFLSTNVTAADLVIDTTPANFPVVKAPYTPLGSLAANAEALADEVTNYVRGCVFGTNCTDRAQRLGDIFHSNPLLVGPPNAPINDSTYFSFASTYQFRPRVMYAGANDGFLHAFDGGEWRTPPAPTPHGYDAGTGVELFGFMPWQVRQNVKNLPIDTPPRDYYYVDGSPQAGDVWLPATPTAGKVPADWHTVLLGGLRQGGRSVYALDVTDPPAITGSNGNADGSLEFPEYLWEFPCEAASCDSWRPFMGETWSDVVITRIKIAVKLNSGTTDDNQTQGYERWVAIFGAGYDPKGDPNDQAGYDATYGAGTSRAGRGVFMVDIQSGRVLAAKLFDPTAAAGSVERGLLYAMPSTPSVFDLDFDGYADVVYIPDLGGNVWKWVIHDLGEFGENAGVAHDWTQPSWAFKKYFDAPEYARNPGTGAESTGQYVRVASVPAEVTAATPATTSCPAGMVCYFKSFFYPPTGTLKDGVFYLGFGTGERNDLDFVGFTPTTWENNRYYVVKDLDPYEQQSPALATIFESNLVDVDSVGSCGTLGSYVGYFLVARETEKFITSSTIFLGDIWTGAFLPVVSADPCDAAGEAWIYRFSLTCADGGFSSGGSPQDNRRTSIGTGVPTSPRVSVGPAPDPSDPDPECQTRIYMITSDGGISNECGGSPPSTAVKLLNWRER
jgi:type IV pilus assembly protein PilY1